jgi:hypothetical protein
MRIARRDRSDRPSSSRRYRRRFFADRTDKLTLLVGAGAAMDAGLASSERLLKSVWP